MLNFSKKNVVLCCSGFISLLLGALIYLLFRPNTYLSDFLKINVPIKTSFSFLYLAFIKFYLVDFLWAFSLNCGLHIVFQPSFKKSLILSAIVSLYGGSFEWLQWSGLISGTGDWWDIFMFILAALAVSVINQIFIKGEKI